jgi:putative aldouronate transport system substrate-binding protein
VNGPALLYKKEEKEMRLKRAFLPVLAAVLLIASGLVGCQQTTSPSQAPQASPTTASPATSAVQKTIYDLMAEDAKNPVTMTITLPLDTPPAENSPIFAELAKRTGITFKLNAIPGDAHEKLGMMLASGNLTDVVIVYPDQLLSQYKQSDQVLDLLPYLKKDSPTLYALLTSDANLNCIKYFTESDGRVLYLRTSDYLIRHASEPIEDPNMETGYPMLPWGTSLYALYPAIDEAIGKKITSLDEWYQAMVAYKAKYPGNYATTMCSEYGSAMLNAFAQIYGYKVETIAGTAAYTKDGSTYQSIVRFPEALDSLKYLNKLYKEGLMDPEGPIQNKDAFVEKMSSGKVFTFLGPYEKIYTANDALAANESTKNAIFIPECVKGPGVAKRYEANYAFIGYNCMIVTKKCVDPDRYFRFLDYLNTDEGLILQGWGIKDEDYIVGNNGRLSFSQEQTDRINSDDKWKSNRGIALFWRITPMLALLSNGEFEAGSPGYEDFAQVSSPSSLTGVDKAVADSKYNYFTDFTGNYWKDASTLNITLPSDSEESVTLAKIQTPLNDLVCKAIVADSDAQIEQLFNDAIAQFELDGLKNLEKFIQDSVDSRRE